jgi:hypothetical protein
VKIRFHGLSQIPAPGFRLGERRLRNCQIIETSAISMRLVAHARGHAPIGVQRQQVPAMPIGGLHVAAVGREFGGAHRSFVQCDPSPQLLRFGQPATVDGRIYDDIRERATNDRSRRKEEILPLHTGCI